MFLPYGDLGKTVGKKPHLLVPPLPQGTSRDKKHRNSVRQPSYLLMWRPLGFAPPPRDGFALLAAAPWEEMRLLTLINVPD